MEGFELERLMSFPPGGAGFEIVSVAWAVPPPKTAAGETDSVVRRAGGAAVTLNDAVRVTPP